MSLIYLSKIAAAKSFKTAPVPVMEIQDKIGGVLCQLIN